MLYNQIPQTPLNNYLTIIDNALIKSLISVSITKMFSYTAKFSKGKRTIK